MEAQVLKSLAKLRKACTRSHRELRDVIDAAQAKVSAAVERSSSAGGGGGGGVSGGVEVPFEPFLLACLTRHAKLMVIALDCIEKFLAFGFLRGNGAIPEGIRRRLVQKTGASTPRNLRTSAFASLVGGGSSSSNSGSAMTSGSSSNLNNGSSSSGGGADGGADFDGGGGAGGGSGTGAGGNSNLNDENWKLIDCIIEVICECNDHPDETVQIQVLRVLLTAVTTTTCEVHEHSLLKAVRACYHIHLVSKNATNQMVAKATLQQINSIVFQRMETFDQRVEQETAATLKDALEKSAADSAASSQEQQQQEEANGGIDSRFSTASDIATASTTTTLVADANMALYPEVALVLGLVVDGGASTITTTSDADATTGQEDPQPPSQPQQQRQKKQQSPNSTTPPMFAPSFPSVLHKDAFLLFRSLCRISMRSVAEDSALGSITGGSNYLASGGVMGSGNAATDDPFAFQSKILSLELVLSIINNAGPSFRRGERFIHAIRQYLCQSLLQNCTSNYTQIVGLSLQVFLVLINNFKRHLKAEIDIFVTSIFLRILQSENSSFEHKMLVLEVLNNLCDDASILGEIFLNYDCDWNTNDLFRQIIDALAKIAKGKKETTAAQYANMSSTMRLKMQQNDAALVLKGLECLTATVASLKKAANFVETEKKTTSARTNSGASQPRQHDSTGDNDDDSSTPTATSPSTSASTSSAMSAVEAFDRKKKRQEELANGVLKFNAKPSAGIQYLVQHGHMGQGTPRDVARFLHEHNDKLDKTMVGDYLGKEQQYQNGFCVKVLHEYVDMMDFTGMEIDVAIRHFLAGFRLPGESQKIDRMMEKFAERFYSSCPPGLFPSADTAFILSFSIIMLQTDLHNPSIPEEKKMDKAGFLRNNRGINNGEDLPEEYMGGIFDRIKQSPISLKEDEDFKARNKRGGAGVKAVAATTIFGTSIAAADRQRRDAYIKERETMVRQSEALFKRRNPAGYSARNIAGASSGGNPAVLLPPGGEGSDGRASAAPPAPTPPSSMFHLVTDFSETSFVRPMFETVWAPLLASCSVIFESSDAPVAIQLCLNSFKHAIHLSARLNMPSERDAFVTVLAKFTALHTTASRVMRAKNIEAIKALISISVKEGNYLGDSWHDSLQCISQLARVQTHAQGLHSEMQFFNYQSSPHGSSSSTGTPTASLASNGSRRGLSSSSSILSPSPSHRESSSGSAGMGAGGAGGDDVYNSAIEDENASRVLAEIDSLASDRVFSSSVTLSDSALQEFVQQLCVVSLTECSGAISNGGRVLPPSSASGRGEGFLSAPRVFSLQKLVEVADMNMNTRSRVVWASTWRVLSRHFTAIGCDENLSIAMYAIDSLRQLSMKFLEREELKDFNFQRLFLEPFEVIMSNAISMEIRELVLRCVENMILARVTNIKSGWKTIWGVLRVAAETYEPGNYDQQDKIVRLGFQIAQRVFDSHFDRIVEVFVDAVECLLAFAVCGSDEVERNMAENVTLTKLSIDCISLLENVCMEKLATGQVIEKLFVETSVAKRVGFKKRGSVIGAPDDAEGSSTTSSRSSRASVRYEKQESSRTLEEEISALSPASSPKRKSSMLSVQTTSSDASATAVYNDSSAHTRMWWPVLTALSTLSADRRIDVRLAALHGLFNSLEKHGGKFSPGLWSLVFKGVLIPLLDELRHLEVFVEKGARAAPKLPLPSSSTVTRIQYRPGQATSTYCLQRLLECFGMYYDVVGFLPEVLFLLGKCMDTTDMEEELAAASATSLEQMLVAHGHKFPEDVWGLIADELRSLMARAEPTWIFFMNNPPPVVHSSSPAAPPSPTSPASQPSPMSPGLLSPRLPSVIAMYPNVVRVLGFRFPSNVPAKVVTETEVNAQRFPSRTHLAVILALQHVLGHVLASRFERQLALSEGHVASLMACLRESFQFARKVNDAVELRLHLQRAGWSYGKVDASGLPSLLLQEVEGKRQYLHVLLSLIRETHAVAPSVAAKREEARKYMTQLLKQTLQEYLTWTIADEARALEFPHVAVPVDATQRAARYAPLMVRALSELAEFDGEEVGPCIVDWSSSEAELVGD